MIHELDYGIVTTRTSKSDVDWDDLTPLCEAHNCRHRPKADYLTGWIHCKCYEGVERFQCDPCVKIERYCDCGVIGFHNIIAKI